jgi:hypothetical protein
MVQTGALYLTSIALLKAEKISRTTQRRAVLGVPYLGKKEAPGLPAGRTGAKRLLGC